MTEPTGPTPTASGSHGPCDLHEVVRNALERLVVIREAMEDGDYRLADAVAFDLEIDLSVAVGETA